jgi:hypothetical protein
VKTGRREDGRTGGREDVEDVEGDGKGRKRTEERRKEEGGEGKGGYVGECDWGGTARG